MTEDKQLPKAPILTSHSGQADFPAREYQLQVPSTEYFGEVQSWLAKTWMMALLEMTRIADPEPFQMLGFVETDFQHETYSRL